MRFFALLLLAAAARGTGGDQEDSAEQTDRITDSGFFLNYFFEKYGHQGVISFEGFEHLMESLGLARFERRHSVAEHRAPGGGFREVHDALHLHTHSHPQPGPASAPAPAVNSTSGLGPVSGSLPSSPFPAYSRRRRHTEQPEESKWSAVEAGGGAGGEVSGEAGGQAAGSCLSPVELLLAFGLEGSHEVAIDAPRFLRLCPALVYELDERSCGPPPVNAEPPRALRTGPASLSVWWMASASVLLVSLGSLLLSAVISPFLRHSRHARPTLDALVAMGAGTLAGDSLMHLLPHAIEEGGELAGAAAMAAMGVLFTLEKLLRLYRAKRDGKPAKTPTEESTINNGTGPEDGAGGGADAEHGHSHGGGSNKGFGAVVYMAVVGDGVHNLTDGMAIGAAFAGDRVAGCATALAVFCHELPHEFGDFALLLRSGMRVRTALMANACSSLLAALGMAVGICIAGSGGAAAAWVYAVTAGAFLYIALASLLPELNRGVDRQQALSVGLQLAGAVVGGGIMLAVALCEHSLRAIFQ